jgi:oligopeptide/dipeptide ABC transporter ATP-binding protein
MGSVDQIFYEPQHPYTLGLLASLPRLDEDTRDKRLYRIKGQPPSLVHVPPGCPFHPRCDFAKLPDPCSTAAPELRAIDDLGHVAACHFSEEVVKVRPADLRTPAS